MAIKSLWKLVISIVLMNESKKESWFYKVEPLM